MSGLGIYIQIPFCASKCSFCNFSSQVARREIFGDYCRAVEREILSLPALYEAASVGRPLFGMPVDTLYIGGGTPPVVGADRLEAIVRALRKRFSFAPIVEFTLEVTPGSCNDEFLTRTRTLGVNRLSIGAQSFVDGELRAVGRLHSAADTRELVQAARRAGLANISLDLIAGLPYQTPASWRESLRAVGEIRPEHVSAYLFEVDEKSRLGREVLRHGTRLHAGSVPTEDFLADAYETAREFLRQQGYHQYEISNFALPGYESRHNQKYWRLDRYVGIGAGAHSFDGEHRWANETAPEAYAAKLARGESPITEVDALSPEAQLEEFFFAGLRQHDGVDLAMATQRWGGDRVGRWEPIISNLAARGCLERRANQIRLAAPYYLVSNEVFQEFLVS